MSEKVISKRIVNERSTGKNYLVKQSREDIPGGEEIVRKIRHYLDRIAKLIPTAPGLTPVGYIASFCFERARGERFDYQSASIVDLSNVNIKASDMMLKDLSVKIMNSYGKEEQKVRQDASVINQE